MLPELKHFPIYSPDIWDYLHDMPYMPDRYDRDRLVKAAETDPSKVKRVRLWDYFFRINFNDVGKPQKKELAILENEVAKAQRYVSDRAKKLNKKRDRSINELEKLETALEQYQQRMQFLETEISNLRDQIPDPVSDEVVEAWLEEDINELVETVTEQSGLRGRLTPLLEATNPFCILSPTELQHDIPILYRNKKSDRHKRLRARRFVNMPDGSFADFYGVYSIELIIVADDVLVTYRTCYDFILGHQSEERIATQFYADIIAIESIKGYREVEVGDGDRVVMENNPSLRLKFMSGDKFDVTFPDEDYFKLIHPNAISSAVRRRFDPRKSADNLMKAIRQKVELAKQKREISSDN